MAKKGQTVKDVMTKKPVTLDANAHVSDAAEAMSKSDIGDVIVMDDGTVCGIVTDRDVVVRAVAEGKDPKTTALREICSRELTTITPDTAVDKAVDLMRQRSIRRLPVCDNGKAVGVVSLGDLAIERDPKSALGEISAAPANA